MVEDQRFKNKGIQELLRNIAAAYELTNQNRFRIIAYQRAADTVEHLSRELKDIWQEGKLGKVPTFGETLTASLDEYFRTGTSKHFEATLSKIPSQVFTLMKVPSIGPKKAYKLVTILKLEKSQNILADVLEAARKHSIASIPSFGEKSEADITEAIERYQKSEQKEERMPLPIAGNLANEVIEYLKLNQYVKELDVLGSLRRQVSTIGDVDIAVRASDAHSEEIVAHFIKFPGAIHVDNVGSQKASIFVGNNRRVDLRVQSPETYGSMLQYFTGSKQHNIKLREFALKKGLSLSEYGMKKIDRHSGKNEVSYPESKASDSGLEMKKHSDQNDKSSLIKFNSEERFYNYLGLDYIPPELREGTNEIEQSKKKTLPSLVELKHIRGDLHIHSSYDLRPSHDLGQNTYAEILENATNLGYEYVGFADHNPKVSGLTEAETVEILKKRHHHIHSTLENITTKTKYFIGLEVDIMPDGNIAFPEKAVDYLDYLIVSVHSAFSQGMEEMTKRVLKALSFPKVKILGHPTGRLLNKREGFELNWAKVFEFVKKNNIALEINAFPQRLDLPDSLVREGHQYGVQYSIDTDSHAIDHMTLMQYGVSVARRGWSTKDDIVNTKEYNEFKKWLLKI